MISQAFFPFVKKNLLFLLLLVILSIGVYINALQNSFSVVDDLFGYIENANIRDFWKSARTLHIQNIVYALNYKVFGINPLPLRILAVSNHAIVSILVFITIYNLFNKKVAHIAAILFAVHPVNSEVINWISANFYAPMAGLQYLAILSHLAYRHTNNKKYMYITVSIFALYLILFQHPWVLTTPLAIIIIDALILKKGVDLSFHKIFWLLLLPILAVYFIFRFPQTYSQRMDGQSVQDGKILVNEQSIIPIIEGYPYSIFNALRLYTFPTNLTIYYDGNPLTSLDRLLMFLTFILYCAGVVYAYYVNKKVAGLLLLIPVCIAPVFSPIKVTWYITERYLYAGAGFFTTLLAMLLISVEKRLSIKHLAYIFAGFILLVFAAGTWRRNTDWKTPETLAYATMKTAPKSVRPLNDLAGHYYMNGRIADAKEYYQKALEITASSVAMNNLGLIYIHHGLDHNVRTLRQPYEDILQLAQEAMVRQEPRMALYYYNEIYTPQTNDVVLINGIAAVFIELGFYEKADAYLADSTAINPLHPDTLFLYGYLAFKKGDNKTAVGYLEQVLQIDPDHNGAKTNIEYLRHQPSL